MIKQKNRGRKTGMVLLAAMIVVLAAAFGGPVQAAGNETVTIWIYKVWDDGERAAATCRYLDRDTGEKIRDSEFLVNTVGESYAFAIPPIDGYDYSGLDPLGGPRAGLMQHGGVVVTMYFERQQPPSVEQELYTATYDRNDGSGISTVYESLPAGSEHRIPGEQIGLYRWQYFHLGWSEHPDGEGDIYENYDDDLQEQSHTITIDRDITLYAVWLPIE